MTEEHKIVRRNRTKGHWSRVTDLDAYAKTIERVRKNEARKKKKRKR